MSQFDFGNLESPLSGTAFINTYLEPWRDAVHSTHSGSSRPTYVTAGMIWLDTTTSPWLLKMFNGTADDITLGRVHPTDEWFQPAGGGIWAGSAGGTANALTFTPTIPWTTYEVGKPFEGLITATNTSETVTINISALGTKSVKCSVGVGKVNIPKGGLQNGMIGQFVYDGTDLILLNVRADNKSADIATASTVNLDSATGDYVKLTGTTTITAITLSEGQERTCHCEGIFILTDGTGNSPQGIICPGAASITTAAGDVFIVRGESGGTVRVVNYMRASGAALTGSSIASSFKDRVTTGASTLILSNNVTDATNDIDVTAGVAVSDDGTTVMTLGSAITKRLDAAWAVGTNQGGLDTGSIANTTYHVWLINRPDTNVTDVLFSTSASAPTMPTNYTKKKRIGSIVRASAAIVGFTQYGDEFVLKTPVVDHTTGAGAGTSAITVTLGSIPTGINAKATVSLRLTDNANYVHLSPLSSTDTAVSANSALLANAGNGGSSLNTQLQVWTNTSAQIRARQSANLNGFYISATSYVDPGCR